MVEPHATQPPSQEHPPAAYRQRPAPLAGTLYDRAIRQRITEGHAEFNDVRSSINRSQRDLAGGREIWVACGKIGDQSWFAGEADRALCVS